MLVLNPSLTINQAWDHYTNPLLVNYKSKLTGKVKAQKITTHRMGITVSKKYTWHIQVNNSFQLLRKNNIGTFIYGRTFDKVFKYFVLGGGKTCL